MAKKSIELNTSESQNNTLKNIYFESKIHSAKKGKSKQYGKTKATVCYEYIADYFENTPVHGLRYVGDRSISYGERTCWLVCFIMAMLCAAYFVSLIYITYDKNPVLISVNAIPTPVSQIPFPSITVCSMNKVRRSVANKIIENGTAVEKSMLMSYCGKTSDANTIDEVDEQASNWTYLSAFILKASHPCREMIKLCMWKSKEINCEKIFNPILTDEGVCCIFNQMPSGYIFRYPENFNKLSYNYPELIDDWSQEAGYSPDAPDDVFPWRPSGAGLNYGLTVVLDGALNDYYCSSTISVGFKILMHNPLETPLMEDYGRLSVPGRESWLEIEPSVTETVLSLRSMSVAKRQCYFDDEKYLRFYRLYSQTNCKMECRSNYTMKMCGCVPYFFPRDKSSRVCGFIDANCTAYADTQMHLGEVDENHTLCNCLSGCFYLQFSNTGHYGRLHKAAVKKHLMKNMTMDYFTENIAVIHFYFISPLLTKFIKRELYGFSEFLSNTGGLLGLFLGFSFLSAVELGYYLSLRMLCFITRSKESSESQENVSEEDDALFPFVN